MAFVKEAVLRKQLRWKRRNNIQFMPILEPMMTWVWVFLCGMAYVVWMLSVVWCCEDKIFPDETFGGLMGKIILKNSLKVG